MNAIEQLLSRRSHNQLTAPAPTNDQLEIMFKAALRAPDHGALKPWRFKVYTGQSLVELGELFLKATLKDSPDLSIEKQDKVRNKPLRAPMLVIASVVIKEHKVPKIEQLLSGAASVQNLIMAAHFQNVGAMWRTGDLTYNLYLKELLGYDDNEEIIGFVYLGTEKGIKRDARQLVIKDYVSLYQ